MDFEYRALTDVGRVRANNEDAVLADPRHGIVILADGMGGYNAGEVASAMAVEQIHAQLTNWLLSQAAHTVTMHNLRRAMEICVDNVNRAIFEAAHENAAYAGMGTTLVMAALLSSTLLFGHVGDSRAYRWRAGALARLTHDHSLVQEQIDAGLVRPEEAAVSTYRSMVTRALGVEDTVLLDVRKVPIEPGDLFLLCSDGLTDALGDDELAGVLGVSEPMNKKPSDGALPDGEPPGREPLDNICRRLVNLANHRGGRDNVSVALIRASSVSKQY
jgi:protein phosphatase